METDFNNALITFFQQVDPELQARLDDQNEALLELPCTQPNLGQWIDSNSVNFLLAAFSMESDDFADMFPQLAHLNEAERKMIVDTINQHLSTCPRCARRQSYEFEFDTRFKKLCRENRDGLLELLGEEDTKERAATESL